MKIWHESLAIAHRILLEWIRRRRSLIFWSLFPVLVLILNGLILQERAGIPLGVAVASAGPPTVVGAALFFSGVGGSVATVVAEREQRTLIRLLLSPLRGLSYFIGILVAHWCVGIGQALLVLITMVLMGAEWRGNGLIALGILLLCIAAYVGLGFILGCSLARRTEDVNALVAAIGVPLLILGGTFVPAFLFPESLLRLAQFNPIYHMNEALLGVLVSQPDWGEIAPHLIGLGIFTGVMIVGGGWSYRRMLIQEGRM